MRKRRAVKRDVLPDPIYKSKVVAKLINTVMLDGKKGTAQSIVYEAFNTVNTKTGKDALEVFTEAMENIKPQLEVKSRRVGGSNYQPSAAGCLPKSSYASRNRFSYASGSSTEPFHLARWSQRIILMPCSSQASRSSSITFLSHPSQNSGLFAMVMPRSAQSFTSFARSWPVDV